MLEVEEQILRWVLSVVNVTYRKILCSRHQIGNCSVYPHPQPFSQHQEKGVRLMSRVAENYVLKPLSLGDHTQH
jgi:hypothetical protein